MRPKNPTWYRTRLLWLARQSRAEAQNHEPSNIRTILIYNAAKFSRLANQVEATDPATLDAYLEAGYSSLTDIISDRGWSQQVTA